MVNIYTRLSSLKRPQTRSPHLSLTSPITRNTLQSLRRRLETVRASYHAELEWPPSSNIDANSEYARPRAAVLAPLCNIDGRPGLLLEVRGQLRSHKGEVSFPGGRVDATDESHVAAAIRETEEELGIAPSQIEILGSLAPPQISLRGLRVYPYVGFIHSRGSNYKTDELPPYAELPSLEISSLRPSLPEVAHVFHLPLSDIADLDRKQRLRQHDFRDQEPYWSIDVTDKVSGVAGLTWAGVSGIDEVGGSDREGKLEVWGLTGWYINVLMQWLEVYH